MAGCLFASTALVVCGVAWGPAVACNVLTQPCVRLSTASIKPLPAPLPCPCPCTTAASRVPGIHHQLRPAARGHRHQLGPRLCRLATGKHVHVCMALHGTCSGVRLPSSYDGLLSWSLLRMLLSPPTAAFIFPCRARRCAPRLLSTRSRVSADWRGCVTGAPWMHAQLNGTAQPPPRAAP